ncbi:hypothetical protein ACTJKO_00710 [Curtobacterium sp. 22159]|uniref:hypothetical protein n=1 Tax=Curtobacterium sp. 22159 TaxID=3453882 RepID=UPI003F8645BE
MRSLLEEAASALHDPVAVSGLLLDGDLPEDRLRRQGRIGAGVLAANLALHARFVHRAGARDLPVSFAAFTGESFGMLGATVASGSLTVTDGIRVAEAFTPLMLLASADDARQADATDPFLAELRDHLPRFTPGRYPVEEPMHVLGLVGEPEHLSELLDELTAAVTTADVEVHKRYSWRQTNVYVRSGHLPKFLARLERYPMVEAVELKQPTTFLAHAHRMHVVRDALSDWMAGRGIEFRTPTTPLLANHRRATLRSADDVRDAVLSMTDRVMDSEGTVEEIATTRADLVLEFGFGNRSVELLNANGATTPASAWTSDDDQILTAMADFVRFRSAVTELQEPATTVEERHTTLLRDLVRAATDPLSAAWIRRAVGDAVTDLLVGTRGDDHAGLRRFLDLLQNTLAHRADIDPDVLVARARVKKRLTGDTVTLGHATTELELLLPDGRVETRLLAEPAHAESVVFHFEHPHDARLDDIIRSSARLARAQPIAERIHSELSKATAPLHDRGFGRLSVRAAVAFVAQRTALFELTRTYRPALISQTDHNVAGGDRAGWLVALAVAGAVDAAAIVPLTALTFAEDDHGRTPLQLDVLVASLDDATIPVLSPDGVPLRTRRELQDATLRVFNDAALDRPEHPVQLNGACLVVSLGSRLAPYRVRALPHRIEVISVRNPAELWRKGLNDALDTADERTALVRSDEREHVLRYAQHRKILSSTVNAYIEPGETVVGFGAGGSESMTMFFERDGHTGKQVRKVLSDALTTVNWDPAGTGVMLPPFAKAQRQAEYLQALPDELGTVFPQVGRITARELPVPTHLAADRSEAFRELIYEMSYVPGEEVSRWVERTSPPAAVIARVYEVILDVLHRRVHQHRRVPAPGGTLEEQYFTKIERRLDLAQRTAPRTFGPWLLDADEITVNGHTLRNIGPLLAAFRGHAGFQEVLEPRFHALVMGDTNTENIKVAHVEPLLEAQRLIESGADDVQVTEALDAITAESIGVMFLDPRAIGYRSDGAATRDDPMYDNKPWHNSLGHYDEMHYEEFDLDTDSVKGTPTIDIRFRPGNPYQRAYDVRDVLEHGTSADSATGLEAHFARVMRAVYRLDDPESAVHRDDPHWLTRFVFTMGTHFAAMPPFHFLSEVDGSLTDTPLTQRRPVAIYAEGIKWLNWALEMLEGTRTEFLGLPVPPQHRP